MAKLICIGSQLKSDDCRLKALTPIMQVLECVQGAIIQCPALTDIRRSMYQNIFSLDVDFESIIKDIPAGVLN